MGPAVPAAPRSPGEPWKKTVDKEIKGQRNSESPGNAGGFHEASHQRSCSSVQVQLVEGYASIMYASKEKRLEGPT